MNDERVVVSFEDSVLRLPRGSEIHTVRNPVGGILIGADWPRADLLAVMRQHEIEETGPYASADGYGLAIIDEHGPLFIATVKSEHQS